MDRVVPTLYCLWILYVITISITIAVSLQPIPWTRRMVYAVVKYTYLVYYSIKNFQYYY